MANTEKVASGVDARMSPLGPLPHGWSLMRLGAITSKIGSGATPRGGEGVYLARRQHYALIRSQNVFDRRFSTDGLASISDTHAQELRGARVEPNDALLNITGDGITFARCCKAPENVLPACVNQHVAIIRTNSDICATGYLISYLTHPTIKAYIESFNAGGSRRAITKGHIESFLIPLPPLPEQHAIAAILGALDDKIELNAKMNRTLEAMARAIFKSWFVDFDPVRANLEGRKPYSMDDATAALFPDSFEDSELGLVPKGWKIGTVDDLATMRRAMLDPGQYPEEQFDHYSIPAYDQGQVPSVEPGEAIKSTKFLVPERCVLLSKLNPRFPRVWMPQISRDRRSVSSTEFLVFVPNRACDLEFVYGFFASAEFQAALGTLVTGTSSSHQRVKAENVRAMVALVPDEAVAQAYAASVAPLCSMIASNRQAQCDVTAVRDALLPKLISGQIRVNDAEKVVEGAV